MFFKETLGEAPDRFHRTFYARIDGLEEGEDDEVLAPLNCIDTGWVDEFDEGFGALATSVEIDERDPDSALSVIVANFGPLKKRDFSDTEGNWYRNNRRAYDHSLEN